MAPERRRQLLLGVVVVVLVAAIYRAWSATSVPAPATSNQRAAQQAAGKATPPPQPTAPDVRLDALNSERPGPGSTERNLFRFKPKAPPPPPPSAARPRPADVAPPVPTGPPPPPPLPPIPLKFIGVVERGGGDTGQPVTKVAVLSDPNGHVTHGVEGATIDGRYRIVRIGEQSIELSYLDGRGRQTIRLTGS